MLWPGLRLFSTVIHHSTFHQLGNAVAQKLGMNPQMLLFPRLETYGIGNAAVANLNGRAVLHNAGYVIAYPPGHISVRALNVLQKRLVMGNDEIHIIHVDPAVTLYRWHKAVGLGDDRPRPLHRRPDYIHGHPRFILPISVWKSGLNQGHIKRNPAGPDQAGKCGEKDGGVVGLGAVDWRFWCYLL